MKCPIVLSISFCLILFSCGEKSAETSAKTTFIVKDSVAEVRPGNIVEDKESQVIVKNSSDYSEDFIKGLKANHMCSKYVLKDSFLILGDKDTVTFPNELKIGESVVLTGKKNDLAVALTIKRINYTTLDYKIEMVEFGKAKYNKSGLATIHSSFFLASEIDEDENGLAYASTEYTEEDKDCYTAIRLGFEEGKPYLSAKIKKNCNGKIKDITLDNFTILHEK